MVLAAVDFLVLLVRLLSSISRYNAEWIRFADVNMDLWRPLGGHELLMKYVFPVIARSTLLEGVARSTQYEALLPSQVPKTCTVIWWQVKYISQNANIYSTIHSAVSYSNLESLLEIDWKRKGRRQKIGARRKSSHLFIRSYLCIVNEHLRNGSFDDTNEKLVLFARQCSQYGEADARTYLHMLLLRRPRDLHACTSSSSACEV